LTEVKQRTGRVSKKCRGQRPGDAESVDDLSTVEDEKRKGLEEEIGKGKGGSGGDDGDGEAE
jgi:hypothetical protein